MPILIFIGLLIIGGLLNFFIKLKAKFVYNIAIFYIFLALLLSLNAWVFYFAGIKNEAVLKILSFVMDWGKSLGRLMLGYLVINILFALSQKAITPSEYPIKKIISSTLWAVTILTGNSFILSTVGKIQGFAEMATFFTASGYAIWFLYFIMTAETLGGLGVLLHFKLKTGPLAAAGLILIMIGAVYTHWHNKDPFSDSYAAVAQLITLSLMQVIYYFEKKANSKPLNPN